MANQARFKFGHGRIGDMRFVADITVGIAASTRNFTAFISAANIPALQRKGALAALAGKLDFSRGKLTLGFCGVDMPFGGNDMGRYFSSVVDSGGRRGELASNPNLSAPTVEWAFSKKGSNLPNGGMHMPLTGWGNLPKKRESPPIF